MWAKADFYGVFQPGFYYEALLLSGPLQIFASFAITTAKPGFHCMFLRCGSYLTDHCDEDSGQWFYFLLKVSHLFSA